MIESVIYKRTLIQKKSNVDLCLANKNPIEKCTAKKDRFDECTAIICRLHVC